MVRTVYVDILFLINFSMDFLCFFLLSRLFSRPCRVIRAILASVIGGLYAVFSLFLPFKGLLLLLCDVGVCAVMCLVVLLSRNTPPTRIVTEILLYTGISMALGGVMTAVYSALNRIGISELLASDSDGISSWIFLLLAVIGGGATLLGSRFFKKDREKRYFSVSIWLCGRKTILRAVLDTGNALSDPITGTPAAVVSAEAMRTLLPLEICKKGERDPIGCFSALPAAYRSRARLLPVSTVTGGGMLLAFRTDLCRITPIEGGEEEERVLLIALSTASPEDAEMLLPVGIL